MQRIVLAFSGGLDTVMAIPWLRETYVAEVVAVTVDLGQGRELEAIRDRALAAGASRAHVLDARDEFARDYVLPSLQAGALAEARSPMPSALGRPLIAQKLVEVAAIEQASAVAHGAAGPGGDEVRLRQSVAALNPALTVVAPGREAGLTPVEKVEYLRARGVYAPAVGTAYRIDANLWGRSVQGFARDAWHEPPDALFTETRRPADCPDEPADVRITFARGVPTVINGVSMPLLDLIASLATIAGAHGVGRVDVVERAPGGEARVVCEAPAAVVLHTAHQQLQQLVAAPDLERFARIVSLQYADLVQAGRWFTPMREALDAFVARAQDRVAGTVRLQLFKGACRVVGRTSPFAIGDPGLATPGAALEADPAATPGVGGPAAVPSEPDGAPSPPMKRLVISRSRRNA